MLVFDYECGQDAIIIALIDFALVYQRLVISGRNYSCL